MQLDASQLGVDADVHVQPHAAGARVCEDAFRQLQSLWHVSVPHEHNVGLVLFQQ
jgi:hypothetical protein